MKRATIVRRALLAGTTALAALVLTSACGGTGTSGTGTGGTNGMQQPTGTGSVRPNASASGQDAFNDADVAFAQMMLPHHEQAVQMTTLARTRAADPEIKELAAQFEAEASPQIAAMSGWLKAKDVPTMPAGEHNMPGMSGMPGLASDQDMARLKAAKGVDFDRMFARMMIAHHNGAVQMCRDMRMQGINGAVSDLADAIEQSQTTEVTALQAILDRL